MKARIIYLSLISLILHSSIFTMDVSDKVEAKQQPIICYDESGWYVLKDSTAIRVQNYDVDPILRKMNQQQVQSFLENGYIIAKKMSDGNYNLRAFSRLLGGGPFLGTIAYFGVKTVCYGIAAIAATATAATAVAGGTALIVGSGGAATPAVAAGAAMATEAVGIGIGAALGGSVGGGTVLSIASSVGIAGAAAVPAVASAATTATVATVTSAGGIAGAVAAVETVALAAFVFCSGLPTI